MRLGDIMERRVVTIRPTDTASAAWTRMRRRDIRHLVVIDVDEIVGVISERDLGGRNGKDLRRGRTVKQLMTPQVITVTPDTELQEAADLMRSNLIGSLPIVEDEKLVGIVTATDVFDALGREQAGRLSWAEQQLLRRPSSSKALGGRTVPLARKRAEPGRKRTRARKSSAPEPVPASIRSFGTKLEPHERDAIRRQIDAKLGKFASSIERVTVRVRDVNGPRGGIDKAGRIKVVLRGLPSVVVEEQADNVEAAFRGALADTVRSVRRAVDRRRTKAMKAPTKRAASRR